MLIKQSIMYITKFNNCRNIQNKKIILHKGYGNHCLLMRGFISVTLNVSVHGCT